MSGSPRLELAAVHAGYRRGREALSGVSLAFGAGKVVALLGENGSGKSTLLKVLAGILPPWSGEARLDGRPIAALPRREAALAISYLPQSFSPFFPATSLEIVLLGRTARLGPLGRPTEGDRAAARAALLEVDGAELAGRDVRDISGGERQRVLLARVLAGEAPVLLLDEPTAGLDPRHRYLVLQVLLRRARAGATVVFSTHELDLAARGADEAVLLAGGEVLAAGPVPQTMTEANLSRLYQVTACLTPLPDGRPLVTLGPPAAAGGR